MKIDVYGEFIDVLDGDTVVAQIRLDDGISSVAEEIKAILKYCGKEIED